MIGRTKGFYIIDEFCWIRSSHIYKILKNPNLSLKERKMLMREFISVCKRDREIQVTLSLGMFDNKVL